MSVTAATVITFDQHGVVDASTSDELVVHGPLTLDIQTDEAGTPAPYAVVNTYRNIDTGTTWYVVAWHITHVNAEEDAYEQAKIAEDHAELDDQELSDRLISVSLVQL